MAQAMSTAAPPAHANVAFLRIPRFASRPVGEQAALKEELESRTRDALARIPAPERAVLDADDGLAVVLFGDPARAFDIAQSLAAGSVEPLHVGVNYGPLALTAKGPEGRVFGDGLAAAAAAARFATSERALVTHDFLRALQATEPLRAQSFSPAGDFTDTRVRMHSLYAPDPAKVAARRRRAMRFAATGVAALLLAGVATRLAHHAFFPPQPAFVSLAIKPRGDVYVDGVSRGRTPPLVRVALDPGPHVVSVRHPGFAPLELAVDLKAGEEMKITHQFGSAARPRPRPEQPKGGFWSELRRKLGGS
jgi:hypothetical protein